MPRVQASLTVDRPPAAVYAQVADPARRRALLPDNFRDFRVLAGEGGPGTRYAFTLVTAQGEHPTEVEVTEADPPHALTEQTHGADGYTMRWTFSPEGTGTRATVTTEYAATGNLLYRLVDRWFARKALEQSLLVELTRLKQRAEGG